MPSWLLDDIKNNGLKVHNWNRIEDSFLYTINEAFIFQQYTFYKEMFRNVIDSLIPTGIMDYLVDRFYIQKWKSETYQRIPKVLEVHDLFYSFVILFVMNLLSFLILALERLIVPENVLVNKKLKFAKISPNSEENQKDGDNVELNVNLIKKFRILENGQNFN